MALSNDRLRPVRVLILDMSPLVGSGVMKALESSAFFDVKRARLDDVLSGAENVGLDADVVVTEGSSGLHLAITLQGSCAPSMIRGARILVVSQACSERDIRSALEAGIHGYGTLSMSLEELQEGVRAVANGRRFICAQAAQRLAEGMTREPLTRREAQVLHQLSEGKCNKTIALELEMALGTVKAHMKALMSKLDAKTRTQVVSVAIARGLIDPNDAGARAHDYPLRLPSHREPSRATA